MRGRSLLLVLVLALVLALAPVLVAACTKRAPDALVPHADADAAAVSAEAGAPVTVAVSGRAGPPGAAPRSGEAVVEAAKSKDAGGDAATAEAAAPAEEPAPRVKIATIGMHVGGGPYDEPTKEPMKRSVEPRFPELARCWKRVANPRSTDVGVDLVIEAAGGRAKVSNPRTSAVGEGFVPCVVAFFESIDFERPKTGKTVVSYSVRFTP